MSKFKALFQITLLTLAFTFLAACEDNSRYLIVEANDLGMHPAVDNAIFKTLKFGIVRSASIMAPTPNFEEVAKFAKSHPEYDWGVHLTLNSEWNDYKWGPVLPKETVPSLVDSNGYLHQTVSQVKSTADAKEVKAELKAQIEKIINAGIKISHLDTHMYAVLSRQDLFEVYLELGKEFNLPCLLPEISDWDWKILQELFQKPLSEAMNDYRKNNFPIASYYNGRNYSLPPTARKEYFLSTLKILPKGLSVYAIHPAEVNEEYRSFSRDAYKREADLEIFLDPSIIDEIKKSKIVLTSWREHQERLAD